MSNINTTLSFGKIDLLSCDFRQLGPFWNGISLFSQHWRFYYHFEKGAAIYFEKSVEPIEPGNFYLLPPHLNARTTLCGTPLELFIHFTLLQELSPLKRQIYKVPAELPLLQKIFKLKENFSQGNLYRETELFKMSLLLESIALATLAGKIISNEGNEDARITKAMLMMEENSGDDLSLDAIAARVGMSKNGFIRLFKERTGTTPWKILSQFRIQKAQTLLDTTKMSIDEIATSCGFQNRFQFSKAFKRGSYMPPAAWRKK